MKNLIICCILSLLLCKSEVKKCGDEYIEKCTKCGTGDSENTCVQCIDKYFLVPNGVFCLACNDSLYGQIGCEGNCDSTNLVNDRNVLCYENDCKEGFFNLNGFCTSCGMEIDNCKKCSIELF